MMLQEFFSQALKEPLPGIVYHTSRALSEAFPERAIIDTDAWQFDLASFAEAKLCTLTPKSYPHSQFMAYWDGDDRVISRSPTQAWFEVEWQNYRLEVLCVKIGCDKYYWIMADIREIAENFFAAVCEWEQEVRDEVLVFNGEYWNKDQDLYKDIKSATFDNLVLQGTLAQDILTDLRRFFASKDLYDSYQIPWKRGVLLLGPPGNGKTHAVKALINTLEIPCLYVKSFKSKDHTDETNIRRVFERARETTPCVLVFEDLDAQITDQNRSFFLNELDGFANNSGILALATTNHPEKLDTAIVNRPSRFDRKYHFNLPGLAERLAYIQMWNKGLHTGMQLSEIGTETLAAASDGFSYAYLKELFLASTMVWFYRTEGQPIAAMDEVAAEQVAALREQMVSTNLALTAVKSL